MTRTNDSTTQADRPKLVPAPLGSDDALIDAEGDGSTWPVRLIVAPAESGGAEFGSGKGWFRIADDFDDPLPEFAEFQ